MTLEELDSDSAIFSPGESVPNDAKEPDQLHLDRDDLQSRSTSDNNEEQLHFTNDSEPHLPIIIFHPGSRNLRFGRSDASPMSVLHAIGRRRKKPKERDLNSQQNLFYKDTPVYLDIPIVDGNLKLPPEVESARLQLCHTLQTSLKSDGSNRFATPVDTIAGYNKLAKIESLESTLMRNWEEFPGQDVIVGEDVLKLNPEGDFNIHFPWRRGQPNIHSNVGGSLSSVMTDLCDIWMWCVTEKLKILPSELKHFRAVVIIPVMFDKVHAKEILNMVLNWMGFQQAFLIQDHVCATFGSCLPCATVVDVGDQKISVSCVEDGISCPQSRIELKYGGIDQTHVLWHLMSQAAVPFQIDRRSTWDIEFLSQLKERLCHFNLNRCGPEEHLILWDKPGHSPITYDIHVGDEMLIVPMSYFNPDILRGSITTKSISLYRPQSWIADDPFDSKYISETSRRILKEADGDTEEDDIEESKEVCVLQPSKLDTDKLLGIDQAILQSIESSDLNEDVKRRLYSCILIVGGGFKFEGLGPWLQNKIAMNIPRLFKSDGLEVITQPKEMDPAITTWKGASILVTLETSAELWISQSEWNESGFKILREKSLCTF